MILDGTMPYQVYDPTRVWGMAIAFMLTVLVEAGLIVYVTKKYDVKSKLDWFIIIMAGNLATFLIGMALFTGGV